MADALDEQHVIRLMVRALRAHPGEWLSFRKLSQTIGIASYDANFLGGIADYRHDLFAVDKDKRIKLRLEVVEEVTRKGIENWTIPTAPSPPPLRDRAELLDNLDDRTGACYCSSTEPQILEDLKSGSVPSAALMCKPCWQEICRVRALFGPVDPAVWEEICRKRGYLKGRQNPRGF